MNVRRENMTNKTIEQENVVRNLEDAGCSNHLITEFLRLDADGKIKEQLRLLIKHREDLLNAIHENQKRIDCLDFLIFNIKPQTN